MDKTRPGKEIGVMVYKSHTSGIGGRLKHKAEDFLVEEITPDGLILKAGISLGLDLGQPAEQIHLTLEKSNISTLRAVKELSNALRVSQKRIGYAGTKDKRAVSTQRISVWGVGADDVMRVNLGGIRIRDPQYCDDRINLGDLQANRFTVRIRDVGLSSGEIESRVKAIDGELVSGYPNFFGVQRFGSKRPITHLVGREIVKGNLREAVLIYLTSCFPGEGESLADVRKRLRDTGDMRRAVREYPRHLEYEHSLINHLIREEGDWGGALMQLPYGLRKMFVHAYQSYIFNLALSYYIREGFIVERLPLVGYKSGVDEVTSMILEDEGVGPGDFRVSSLPGLGSAGVLRDAFVYYRDFVLLGVGVDDYYPSKSMVELRFILPKGCYATVLLEEFMKS